MDSARATALAVDSFQARAQAPILEPRRLDKGRQSRNPCAQPHLAVPALIDCLHSPDIIVRYFSVRSLTNFPAQAALILPALTNLLDDPDPTVRNAASNSIKQVVSQAHADAVAK